MGLVAVLTTQLWHHTFLDPTLADLRNNGNGSANDSVKTFGIPSLIG
jgi:hypothetical protein